MSVFSLPLSLLKTQDEIPEWEKELQAELQVGFTWHMEIYDSQLSCHLALVIMYTILSSLN